jgi:hypothetical protein
LKIESELNGLQKSSDREKLPFEVNEEKNNLRLSENQKKCQLLEDFAVRNDLYRAYLGKKQLETNLTKSVTRFLKEKVGFQQAKKDVIERLSIETKMSIGKLLNLRKQEEMNKNYQTLSKLNS